MPTPIYAISRSSKKAYEPNYDVSYGDNFVTDVLNDPEECIVRRLPTKELEVYLKNVAEDIVYTFESVYQKATSKLPFELSHIQDVIVDAKFILDLEANWDSEGAIEIPKIIFDRAIHFVESYSSRVYFEFGIIPVSPEITPLKDGSIDLLWNNDKTSLLVNIKNASSDIAYYYGELYNNNGQIFDVNGQIPTNLIIDTFASWFSYLSKVEDFEDSKRRSIVS